MRPARRGARQYLRFSRTGENTSTNGFSLMWSASGCNHAESCVEVWKINLADRETHLGVQT